MRSESLVYKGEVDKNLYISYDEFPEQGLEFLHIETDITDFVYSKDIIGAEVFNLCSIGLNDKCSDSNTIEIRNRVRIEIGGPRCIGAYVFPFKKITLMDDGSQKLEY